MANTPTPLVRRALWLTLLAVAFLAGRWHGSSSRSATLSTATNSRPLETLNELLTSAKSLSAFAAESAAFFANLDPRQLPHAVDHLAQQTPSQQRETLLLLALRRWGEAAAPGAIARANALTNLPLRSEARTAIYEAWSRRNSADALSAAAAETHSGDRERALATVLTTAAAARPPDEAFDLWERAPADFRASQTGQRALTQMTESACGAGQRAAVQALIPRIRHTAERAQLISTVARHWARFEPEPAIAWLRTMAAPGVEYDQMLDDVFTAFVRKDPISAAAWAVRQPDERRRTNYVAAAVAEWAAYDSAGAETWVNEQAAGAYLDGATSAIATHFIEHRRWPQAFAWTRRILRNEARADLLANLGRIWSKEQPEEFKSFLVQTSLNRTELEMLRSKVVEVSMP